MARIYEGPLSSTGMRMAIVASRFNALIVEPLVAGAIDAFVRTGGAEEDIAIYRCPGSFEIAQVARKVVDKGGTDMVVCLGAVIRGATPHFDHVANAVSRGVAEVAARSPVPVTFGVLTTDTIEQALERAGTKAGNKGFDAAMAAIEMAGLYRRIGGG
jgi:6,7-dimethyl-8-ribityllumazine synthase